VAPFLCRRPSVKLAVAKTSRLMQQNGKWLKKNFPSFEYDLSSEHLYEERCILRLAGAFRNALNLLPVHS
jgi:hypothetical protein